MGLPQERNRCRLTHASTIFRTVAVAETEETVDLPDGVYRLILTKATNWPLYIAFLTGIVAAGGGIEVENGVPYDSGILDTAPDILYFASTSSKVSFDLQCFFREPIA